MEAGDRFWPFVIAGSLRRRVSEHLLWPRQRRVMRGASARRGDFIGTYISNAILPSIPKQDPRYF